MLVGALDVVGPRRCGWLTVFSLRLPANFLGVWEVTKHCRSGLGSGFESGFARYWQSDLV